LETASAQKAARLTTGGPGFIGNHHRPVLAPATTASPADPLHGT